MASDINVRSTGWFIAQTRGRCWSCRKFTPLVAVALPPTHETLETNDVEDGGTEEAWEPADGNALLFHIEHLPAASQSRLRRKAPAFRRGQSHSDTDLYWRNHCEHCDAAQDDEDLFCEPEGAFTPVTPEAASAINLQAVSEPFEALARGYQYDPEFFEYMPRG